MKSMTLNNELEIKFGTKGVKPYTKVDYDNVVRILGHKGKIWYHPGGLEVLAT